MTDSFEYLHRPKLNEKQIREYNAGIVKLLSLVLNLSPDVIDLDTVRDISVQCGIPIERAYAECLASVCGLDTVGRDRALFTNYFLKMINRLDVRDFKNSPYYRNIKIPDEKIGNWELKTMKLKPGELFVCNDFLVTDDLRMIPQLGFFENGLAYPAVLENGREWMTLMPNETVTSEPAVKAANGRVLTFGLGLGYFAYMASEKENVESVTVVDLSPDVIKLFSEYILPQFPHKEKISLICSDAFAYADRELTPGKFDTVFADIWHDVGDGKDLYLRFKEYESKCPGTEFVYWLEDSIKCYLNDSLWP